jgi:hypothetical protein
MEPQSPIRAVIGVSYSYDKHERSHITFYVKRSELMQNYPGVWSLPSIQYKPEELRDPHDLDAAAKIFTRMSHERFCSVGLKVENFLTGGSSDKNPMERMVELLLYRIRFLSKPNLNRDFYTESEWLTREEFEERVVLDPLPCGLCTKLWREFERENIA